MYCTGLITAITSISFKSCSCSNSIGKTSCQKSTIKVLDITPGLTAILTTVESLGRSQVVRQRVLVPPSLGSNPSAPVQEKSNRIKLKPFNFQIYLQIFLDLKLFSFFVLCVISHHLIPSLLINNLHSLIQDVNGSTNLSCVMLL